CAMTCPAKCMALGTVSWADTRLAASTGEPARDAELGTALCTKSIVKPLIMLSARTVRCAALGVPGNSARNTRYTRGLMLHMASAGCARSVQYGAKGERTNQLVWMKPCVALRAPIMSVTFTASPAQ